LRGCLGLKRGVRRGCFIYEVYAFTVRRTAQETRGFVVKQKTVDIEVNNTLFSGSWSVCNVKSGGTYSDHCAGHHLLWNLRLL